MSEDVEWWRRHEVQSEQASEHRFNPDAITFWPGGLVLSDVTGAMAVGYSTTLDGQPHGRTTLDGRPIDVPYARIYGTTLDGRTYYDGGAACATLDGRPEFSSVDEHNF